MIPLGTRVLVKDVETAESLAGSKIILLDDTRKNLTQQQSEVLYAPKKADFKAGAWVIHKPYAKSDGPEPNTYWMDLEDIYAVIEE